MIAHAMIGLVAGFTTAYFTPNPVVIVVVAGVSVGLARRFIKYAN